ncbi:MAG: cysteine synthase B [Planctomyces sp.]|nr:cysteine synthase B [Planctomyces sp.]MBA4039366.1 cysteine synthase B [Planctomyces sp.]
MDHQARVYDSVLEMLPSEENPSPVVRLNRMNPAAGAGYTLYAKLEWQNPFGSVKDRAAAELVAHLEATGQLGPGRPGRGIVEPTSGNTGLSLAAICAVKGYPMRAVVPQKVPPSKKSLLKIAGAELDISQDAMCPLPGTEDGTIGLARTHARASADRYVMPNQYENPINAQAHMRTTGPEIWRQTGGRVTHVFTSLGTCGTVTGLSRFLKAKNPAVRVIAAQPSPGHDVPGVRNTGELEVSKLYDPSLIDEIVEIPYQVTYDRMLELSRKEGLLAGPSSGLIYEAARRVLSRGPEAGGLVGGVGVMIFCDSVFKYIANLIKHHPELLAEGAVQ